MIRRILPLLFFPLATAAQTPIQETGSLQSGDRVITKEPIADSQSISIEGISAEATAPLRSSAPDSGPQPWKDVMGWISLQEGQSQDEVRALLGDDYRESAKSGGSMWTYQDQKALLFGSVTFKEGKLAAWTSPRF